MKIEFKVIEYENLKTKSRLLSVRHFDTIEEAMMYARNRQAEIVEEVTEIDLDIEVE